MSLNNFILTCEKENAELKKELEYFKNRDKRLQQRIDRAINLLDMFISDTNLSKYDTLKILMHTKKILKESENKE